MKVGISKSDKDQNMTLLVARRETSLVFAFPNYGHN